MTITPLLDRVEKKTIRPDGPDGCWIWTGPTSQRGHGNLHYNNRTSTVHRHVWEYYNGPLDRKVLVRHKCDNPPCWNIEHLELGTVQDNSDDMTRRGRSNKGSGRPAAKLTEDAVAEIRKAYAAGGISQTALAVRYGVHQSNICRALKGDLWSHVPVEEVKNF